MNRKNCFKEAVIGSIRSALGIIIWVGMKVTDWDAELYNNH